MDIDWGRSASVFIRFAVGISVTGLLLGACASAPASPVLSVVRILLKAAQPGIGCGVPGIQYKSFTIRIDAFADEQVWAATDSAQRVTIRWEEGFVGGSSAVPVVVDPSGQVVARDGDRVEIPERGSPELHGHFVCPGPDAIYIFLLKAPG